LPPLPLGDDFATDPVPVFATSLGRGAEAAVLACEPTRLAADRGLSFTFGGAPLGKALLVVRNVLFTEIDLNDVGFFTVDGARPLSFSSSLSSDASGRTASVAMLVLDVDL